MRFTSSGLLRALYTVTNPVNAFTRQTFSNSLRRTPHALPRRPVIYRSMPSFPFLGALFSSSSSMAETYPVMQTEDWWRAHLTPGTFFFHPAKSILADK